MERHGRRCRAHARDSSLTRRFGGLWTEEKLRILRTYLDNYTTALKNTPFTLIYVDGFAGAGSYQEPGDDYAEFHDFRDGSTRIALDIDDKPFDRLVFIEEEAGAIENLLTLKREYPGRKIDVIQGDANDEVPEFCCSMGRYDRAVVFLDPFATQVSWKTVEAISTTRKIDCWILFPLMAISRMMPRGAVPHEANARQLDRVFGSREFWRQSYRDSRLRSLFGDEFKRKRRGPSELIAQLYKQRLEGVFHSVAPKSRTLKNSKNSPLFELFFAASNPQGAPIATKIAGHILGNL